MNITMEEHDYYTLITTTIQSRLPNINQTSRRKKKQMTKIIKWNTKYEKNVICNPLVIS